MGTACAWPVKTHIHTPACASVRGRATLDLVPHSTSRTVDQTPPNEREGAGAFTVWAYTAWSAPRGWLSKMIKVGTFWSFVVLLS
jgi:hypothetical protein